MEAEPTKTNRRYLMPIAGMASYLRSRDSEITISGEKINPLLFAFYHASNILLATQCIAIGIHSLEKLVI